MQIKFKRPQPGTAGSNPSGAQGKAGPEDVPQMMEDLMLMAEIARATVLLLSLVGGAILIVLLYVIGEALLNRGRSAPEKIYYGLDPAAPNDDAGCAVVIKDGKIVSVTHVNPGP